LNPLGFSGRPRKETGGLRSGPLILASRDWTDPQRRWLERIAKQLRQEIVVDRPALDQETFDAAGGFKRLNKVFDGRLETVLGDINEALWRDAG
jgi:type I restriction enzyme R subunit